MRAKCISILMVVLFLFVSCASTNTITNSEKENIKNHTLAVTKRKSPNFYAYNATTAMAGGLFGAIGGAVAGTYMAKEGDEIVQQYKVEDPSSQISKEIVKSLSDKFKVSIIDLNNSELETNEINEISSMFKNVDYVLDIKTTNWGYTSAQAANIYHIYYTAKLQIIDTNSNAIVAEGVCSHSNSEDGKSFRYEEIVGNNAAKLKEELRFAKDYCVQDFKENVLAMN